MYITTDEHLLEIDDNVSFELHEVLHMLGRIEAADAAESLMFDDPDDMDAAADGFDY